MADEFLLSQITEIEAIIVLLNTAIREVLISGHSSYSLNTGQTEQQVSRLDLTKLRKMRTDYIAERDSLRSACGLGEPVVNVRPGF